MTTDRSDALPPPAAAIDYVARWAEIVERRRAQMDAAYAAAGRTSDDYWGRRATSYRAATHAMTPHDPFLPRLLAHVDGTSSVLDVGAGPGRHTLAIAPHVSRVTAVEPSAAMLGLLREDLKEQGIDNVRTVDAAWMDAEVEPADVVICSHVLYPIGDVVPFVRKLEAHARERVFVYLRADPMPTDFGLWSEFYGEPLQAQPTHADLFNVLAQIGVMADVEVVCAPLTWGFDSLDDAVREVSGRLCLAADDAPAQEKLRRLLASRFDADGGRIMPDSGAGRSAIFSWRPESAGG
ncbi:MAG: class I SAM-dependent methyltransferase [Dehalococcoidia bacterium]|nr:class I SAM-dependent methyltransferase [Dehalococcoidia bacterium]